MEPIFLEAFLKQFIIIYGNQDKKNIYIKNMGPIFLEAFLKQFIIIYGNRIKKKKKKSLFSSHSSFIQLSLIHSCFIQLINCVNIHIS